MPKEVKKTPGRPNVDYIRSEVADLIPRWALITDVLGGQLDVKAKGSTYLVMPNADDTSPENLAAFEARLKRAVFYNVTARTHAGLVGQVFSKDPSVELPATMKVFVDDVDGSGVRLDQQAKLLLGHVLAYGRGGLLTDFPNKVGETGVVMPTSRADITAGLVRPTVNLYRPESIINWRTKVVGSLTVLTLVVLVESYLKDDDGFKPTFESQWRVLRLEEDSGFYTVELYRKGLDGFESQGVSTPADGAGKPFNRIPFTFVGVNDNNPEPDAPPLLDLALLNLAHYNNSADNEDSVYLVGMPMYWFAGLSEKWVKDVLKGKVRVGSSQAVLLPEGGAAGITQAASNTMAFTNMEHKEKQMVALGAKLVENDKVQRTATEAGMDEASELSILCSAANNVSQAYQSAFRFVARFLGAAVTDNELAYELNTDLAVNQLDSNSLTALVAAWQGGTMDFEEMRWNLRRSGLVYKDDKLVQAATEAEIMTRTELTTPPTDKETDPNVADDDEPPTVKLDA